MRAELAEVFSSIQGEGKYVGYRQVFVRFAGCNLACAYCDTPQSRAAGEASLIETAPGSRDFAAMPNPLPVADLAACINRLLAQPHHSVSLTGGEPLCQAGAIAALAPLVDAPLYLETNGTMPEKLAAVLPHIDIVSMDIKLPSTAGREYWDEHRRFLELATACDVFVKMVVSAETEDAEFFTALELIAAIDAGIPLIIQPVTPLGGVRPLAPEDLSKRQAQALSRLRDVRAIGQTHKYMGQL